MSEENLSARKISRGHIFLDNAVLLGGYTVYTKVIDPIVQFLC